MLNTVVSKVQQALKPEVAYQPIDWVGGFSGATELESVIGAKDKLAKVDSLMKKDLKARIQVVLNLDEKTCEKVQSLTHSYLTSLRNNDALKKSVEIVVIPPPTTSFNMPRRSNASAPRKSASVTESTGGDEDTVMFYPLTCNQSNTELD